MRSIKQLSTAVFLLVLVLFSSKALANELSQEAKIYLVTCGPNQTELYSAFGHTAVRVYDPQKGFDLIFNYGVFNFNQPNFYLNFAKGYLLYKLAVYDYQRFLQSYQREERYVFLQELNFNQQEKDAYFTFLKTNAQPDNASYYYDYFYDNCATRPRDGMESAMQTLGKTIAWDTSYAKKPLSIRDLCENYLQYQRWGDLGIDLCLGLPMDKKATALEYTFLPDYMMQAAAGGSIKSAEGEKRLVAKTEQVLFETFETKKSWFTPVVAFSCFLLFGLLLSFAEHKYQWYWPNIIFDKVLFTVVGLVGWLLFVLWLGTNHTAAARNMNILWAFPLYFPFVLLVSRKAKGLGMFIMRFSVLLQLVVLMGWFFWPQDLHPGLFPLSMLLLWRSFWRVRMNS